MTRGPLLLACAALGVTGIAFGLETGGGAQTVHGLDLAKVRARAKLSPADAEALVEIVARRGEALRDEALMSQRQARANGALHAAATKPKPKPTESVFDFDAMVAAAGKADSSADAGPRLIAFASLSMPAASLRQLIADIGRAGGVVVFRGFPGSSARRFTSALAKVLPEGGATAQIGIDPRLFRAFQVEAAPTYVVTMADFDLCDGFDCRTKTPPHDRMSGNVSVEYALATFARGGGPAAAVAAALADRLQDETR